jgi:hypothetical protein
MTDRFDKPVTILRNPSVFEGAPLSNLCGFVANNLLELCWGYW